MTCSGESVLLICLKDCTIVAPKISVVFFVVVPGTPSISIFSEGAPFFTALFFVVASSKISVVFSGVVDFSALFFTTLFLGVVVFMVVVVFDLSSENLLATSSISEGRRTL